MSATTSLHPASRRTFCKQHVRSWVSTILRVRGEVQDMTDEVAERCAPLRKPLAVRSPGPSSKLSVTSHVAVKPAEHVSPLRTGRTQRCHVISQRPPDRETILSKQSQTKHESCVMSGTEKTYGTNPRGSTAMPPKAYHKSKSSKS